MQTDTTPLSFKEKVGYGLGDAASNFYLYFFGAFLMYYYTDVAGLAPAAVGTMLLISRFVDAASDPIMGMIADRTTSRWGKFRPYLLLLAVPYGVFGVLMFMNPDFSPLGKLIYAYITYNLVMLVFTAINIPYSALLGVISPSSAERTKATTYRMLFAASAGIFIGGLVKPLKDFLGGDDEALGFLLTIMIFAVISTTLFLITFATTKERVVPMPQKKSDETVKSDLKLLIKNASWLALAVCGICLCGGLAMRLGSVVYYIKYVVQDGGEKIFLFFDLSTLYLTAAPIAQCIGVLLTPFLSSILDKGKALSICALCTAICFTLYYFLPTDWIWVQLALHCIGFFTIGPLFTLIFAMYTDCADSIESQSGRRITGLTVSASIFSLKVGTAIGAAMIGYWLSYAGFVANEEQSAETIRLISIMFCFLPATAYIGCTLSISMFYSLTKAKMLEIEKDLIAKRALV